MGTKDTTPSKGKGKGEGGGGRRVRVPDDPDMRRLTTRQASYFAERTGVSADALVGQRVADIKEKLRLFLPPELWFHQRVCGRVVKTDPTTGEKRGVPFATVEVQDTDCSFLGFFPVEHPYYWWLWPIRCDREVIATVTTDECGNFCVNIPRWDIDRVLRIRKERRCFPDIGRVRIPDIDVPVDGPWPPIPLPDPIDPIDPAGPIDELPRFGAPLPPKQTRYVAPMAPPLSQHALDRAAAVLGRHAQGTTHGTGAQAAAASAEALPTEVALAELGSPVGPFLRCRDVWTVEWDTYVDVPDITFRVTQDVDGDGTEEVIYSEGWFDVRWNDTDVDDVELEASPIALASDVCGPTPDEIPCSDVPAIVVVGRMPTSSGYLDADGYSTRVNAPRSGGDSVLGARLLPARSPMTGTLQLSGCYDVVDGGAFYRVLDEFEGVEQPLTGLSWTSARKPSLGPPPTITMTPDAAGWYAFSDAQQQFNDKLVLNWPVTAGRSGLHRVRLEIADAARSHLAFSAVVPLRIDDTAPDVSLLSVRWRASSATPWSAAEELLTEHCPVLDRPAGADVEMRVVWSASAEHFRNTSLSAFGCGAGSGFVHTLYPDLVPPLITGGDPAILADQDTLRWWHTTTAETGLTRTDVFRLPSTAAQGAYGINAGVTSRAFSPAGSFGPSVDWLADSTWRRRTTQFRFAVIDS